MPQFQRHRRSAILIVTAVLATAGATGLRFLFSPALGSRVPFLLYVLTVAVAAEIAGTISGLIVTGLSVVLIGYFAPTSDPHMHTVLIIFGAAGTSLSLFGGRQKRTKDELAEARFILEAAQHIANVGSWDSNLVTNALRLSPETYQILGFPVGTTLRREDFYECIPPDERDTVRAAVAKAIETDTEHNFEHHVVRRSDGDLRLVHHQARIVKHGNTPHLIGSINDITEKLRGEIAQQILSGLLHVCSACRRIHDGQTKEWYSMEGYLRLHTTAKFSHGMCPDCGKQWFSEAPNRANGESATPMRADENGVSQIS